MKVTPIIEIGEIGRSVGKVTMILTILMMRVIIEEGDENLKTVNLRMMTIMIMNRKMSGIEVVMLGLEITKKWINLGTIILEKNGKMEKVVGIETLEILI